MIKEEMMKREFGRAMKSTPFSSKLLFSFLMVVLFSITGCGTSRILSTDFDQYDDFPQDFQLVGGIPGLPSGDLISDASPLVAVTNDAALPGKNLLVGGTIGDTGLGGSVDFTTASHETPDEYRIQWYGRRKVQANNAWTSIVFLDSSSSSASEALGLRFAGVQSGEVSIIQLETGDNPPPAPILFDFNKENPTHTLLITLHMSTHTIDVTFVPNLLTPPNAPGDEDWSGPTKFTGLHFKDPDFSALRIIRVEAESQFGAYYIDNLNVFTKTTQ
jgi:hypothetical protein